MNLLFRYILRTFNLIILFELLQMNFFNKILIFKLLINLFDRKNNIKRLLIIQYKRVHIDFMFPRGRW